MGLNRSNEQIAQELGIDPDDTQVMASQLREGIVQRKPEVKLSGEVECDDFFEFVHNVRRRGKALLGAAGLLVAPLNPG